MSDKPKPDNTTETRREELRLQYRRLERALLLTDAELEQLDKTT